MGHVRVCSETTITFEVGLRSCTCLFVIQLHVVVVRSGSGNIVQHRVRNPHLPLLHPRLSLGEFSSLEILSNDFNA